MGLKWNGPKMYQTAEEIDQSGWKMSKFGHMPVVELKKPKNGFIPSCI